ncbi:MAG: hypothetical protein F4114_15790 [Rhodospirillaceae bacterium]|nr:hypothetical protein [Rhodospirillaceae bacterium]MYB14000.1 hypothetical protein [Rhodospirillaceae bacterium]MYI50534.1 hypothetical protein [Rhodospirillaceae bacterium]
MDSENRGNASAEAGKTEKRTPRSIRFREAEWERIEDCAEKHSMAAAEFVRFAALSAVEGGCEACKRLAPLVETTFRATHIMVTKMRTDMLAEGRAEELDELVAGARAQQDRLPGREPAEGSGGN